MSGSALTLSHEHGTSWLVTTPAYRTDERKGRKGRFATPSPATPAAHLIAFLAVTVVDSFAILAAFAFIVVGAIAA
jgi:hypothetical protein